MKTIITLLFISILTITQSKAQILHPVTWSYAAKKTSPTEAVVLLKATIEKGWHIYSQNVKEGGPVATTFTFAPSKEFSLVGKTAEPKPLTRMEKVFAMEVSYFENAAIFQQKIRLKKGQTTVAGKLSFMTCNDEKCLPPDDVEFSIPVK
ncbi:protein-disulfide reductase DsbD family protein [Mucilaginibacter sabulilitoris]|uniref:Protein-disulfide reductase DsbD family protein n=1 Tax=Mucilaginibacter sabulilitoris TaxID=1173583 RepID=A0ABZ0TRG8_9SPHI|nr:protein-disulfide reductase DsbD domain-containing protein [Mucilaginibacter sabulilitoris]WPU94683.1 protein-disulfide reductase DsbD family protein [Mucilaginibacter sabulilitoris]